MSVIAAAADHAGPRTALISDDVTEPSCTGGGNPSSMPSRHDDTFAF
jgi:hypothetical protein